jgi:hypothetical protein
LQGKTKPMMNPVTATNNKERFPIKALTKEFFKFKGRLKDSLKTDLQKRQVRQFRVRKI